MELLIPQIFSFVTLFAGMGEHCNASFSARHSVVIRQRATGTSAFRLAFSMGGLAGALYLVGGWMVVGC